MNDGINFFSVIITVIKGIKQWKYFNNWRTWTGWWTLTRAHLNSASHFNWVSLTPKRNWIELRIEQERQARENYWMKWLTEWSNWWAPAAALALLRYIKLIPFILYFINFTFARAAAPRLFQIKLINQFAAALAPLISLLILIFIECKVKNGT